MEVRSLRLHLEKKRDEKLELVEHYMYLLMLIMKNLKKKKYLSRFEQLLVEHGDKQK